MISGTTSRVYRYGARWWQALAGLVLLVGLPLSWWTLLDVAEQDVWPLTALVQTSQIVFVLFLGPCAVLCIIRWLFPCRLKVGSTAIGVPSIWSFRTVEIEYETIQEIRLGAAQDRWLRIIHQKGTAKINPLLLSAQDLGDVLALLQERVYNRGQYPEV
jgi:hypothetical protein